MTYPDPTVQATLAETCVTVKLVSAVNQDLARKMNVRWLPGTVICDADERPAHTVVGFLPPADLLTEIAFGRAIVAMGEKRYDEAHALFERVAGAPDTERAPEALYWLGVSRYRETKDFWKAVEAPWGRILAGWPRSLWARKVGFAFGKPTSQT